MSITIKNTSGKNSEKLKNEFNLTILLNLRKRKKVSEKEKTRLYSDLHLLFSSGLDMNTVFTILIDQTSKEQLKNKYTTVLNSIISGESLASSLKKQDLAGEYEYFALLIGEESGKLDEVLSEIKKYYERRLKQKRQVTSALTYPTLVIFTAMLAVGFMLNVIVPMFEEVFQRFQGSLPPLTQKIIYLSAWFKHYGWLLIISLIILIIILSNISKKIWFKKIIHTILLKIPVFGPLIKSIETSRFCHIMTLLTSAHSPLVQSLGMVTDMITFLPLKAAIIKCKDQVTEGNSFYKSLEYSNFFDKKFTSLIRASEEVNQLDYAFEKLNSQYNEQIDHRLSIIGNLMEPLLIIFVGGIVALILIAMYLPLFQIGSSIY